MASARDLPTSLENPALEIPADVVGTADETYLLLRLSPEVNQTVEELMERTHLPKEDVLNMAVGFLKAAADAIDEGKHVGIAADEQNLEIEFTGL